MKNWKFDTPNSMPKEVAWEIAKYTKNPIV